MLGVSAPSTVPGSSPVVARDLLGATVPEEPVLLSSSPADRLPSVEGYEVLDLLGQGGMGVVYRARNVALKRLVALKMIRGSHIRPDQLARFRSEAEAVARLQHANIVQIYEVGEHDGLPYLALEFVEGSNLDQQLDGTPLPAREAAHLTERLARAVHYAHERGVVHRDLKPANILLSLVPGPSSWVKTPGSRPPDQGPGTKDQG